jgi:glycerate 2-kinase
MTLEPKSFLLQLFKAGLAAVDPKACLAPHFPPVPKGRLVVLGAGKAAAAMGQAVENHYGSVVSGMVVTRDGYALPTHLIEVLEAGHPLPDQRSVIAAQRMLALAQQAQHDDLVLCLWSGGASSLLAAPMQDLAFDEKQRISAALLKSGAAIDEINCVRKHLSIIKGGRLAHVCAPARVVSLIVSDVVGDDISVIASGPTALDPTTCLQALEILNRYAIPISAAGRANLANGMWESPKKLTENVTNTVVIRPADAFAAAKKFCADHGMTCIDLGESWTGTAGDIAAQQAQKLREIVAQRGNSAPPLLILSGGEAVVHVTGAGTGGPNTEFALALACELKGQPGVFALACDSDGTDGYGGHAGAMVTPDTLIRALGLGLNVRQAQVENNTAPFFEALGDLITTGPTFTNVNDFRAILIV